MPSILYCCNGLINFSILGIEKLVCKFEVEICRIFVFSRRIAIHD